MMMMMSIVITIVLRMMIKLMKGSFGVCLGGLGVLWGICWRCHRQFRSPFGAFQNEAKSKALSTSQISEDVSSETAILSLGRLKTSSPNLYVFEDVSSETALSEDSSYFATHFNISFF